MGVFGVRGEVVTGRREPTRSELMKLGSQGLIADTGCEIFWVRRAGERKGARIL
jgi:hypothetical protein